MIRVSKNDRGLMILTDSDQGMRSSLVEWSAVANPDWMKDLPLQVEHRPDGESTVVDLVSGSTTVEAFRGTQADAFDVAKQITAIWMTQNGFASDPSSQPATGTALAESSAEKTQDASADVSEAGWSHKKKVSALLAACVVALAVGYYGTGAYTAQKVAAPALDLTSMPIAEIAQIDSNPAALDKINEEMIAALNVGKLNAGKSGDQMEKEHIAALKSLGLEPSEPSMRNAMACLGAM